MKEGYEQCSWEEATHVDLGNGRVVECENQGTRLMLGNGAMCVPFLPSEATAFGFTPCREKQPIRFEVVASKADLYKDLGEKFSIELQDWATGEKSYRIKCEATEL